MPELSKKNLRNLFLVIAGALILYWILHERAQVSAVAAFIYNIFSPFVSGAVIAFVLNVPMRAIENLLKGIKKPTLRRALALTITVIVALLVLTLMFLLLIPQITSTVETLVPQIYEFFNKLGVKINAWLEANPEVMEWVTENTDLKSVNWSELVQKAVSMVGDSVSTIITSAFTAIGTVLGFVVNLVIAVVFSIYCLLQKETLARQGRKLMYAFFPEHFADYTIRVLRLSNATFSNFFSGQCIEVCILGGMFAISMMLFRMPYVALVSLLIALTAFIPVVGAWIGCGLGAFFILVDDPMLAVWFVVLFVILQQIENNMIYPRVVGTSIGLSGMWVLVAIAIGGAISGVVGMFLMIPFASVLYTLLSEATAHRLEKRNIDPDKLIEHPPEGNDKVKKEKKKKSKKK